MGTKPHRTTGTLGSRYSGQKEDIGPFDGPEPFWGLRRYVQIKRFNILSYSRI